MKRNLIRTFFILLIIITLPFPVYADFGAIRIDGYYDDWEDKPYTEVYPGKNPPESKINYVSLFRDESNVYVHVTFAFKNNQDIKNLTVKLYTNMGDEDYDVVPDDFDPFTEEDSDEPDLSNEIVEESTGEPDLSNEIVQESTGEPDADTAPVEPAAPAEDSDLPETGDVNRGSIIRIALTDSAEPSETPAVAEPAGIPPEDQSTGTEPVNGPANPPDDQNDIVPEDVEPDTSVDNTDSTPENTLDNTADNAAEQLDPDSMAGSEIQAETESEEPAADLNTKKPETYGTWSFSVYQDSSLVGSGYYTRAEGEPDELELSIPISSISPDYDGIKEITMGIKKLGPQQIMSVGVDTAPYVGVALGAGIAILSWGAYKFKKKRVPLPQ